MDKFIGFAVMTAALLMVGAAAGIAGETSAAANTVSAKAEIGNDPAMVAKGKALYVQNCLHCHGINMVNPGTYSFDLRQFPHDEKSRFVNSVTHGKNGRMPAWGDILKAQDIDELWAYVKSGGKG